MSGGGRSHRLVLMGFLAATIWTSPVLAQPSQADIEALIDASAAPASAMALARRQIGERDLLGAAATLERVLIAHPEARGPRLLYASLLCRLDDRAGAHLELSLLGREAGEDPEWNDVAAACEGTGSARPAGGGAS